MVPTSGTREYSIVLLSGWSGSGKDVAAHLMCEEMGYTRLAFADIVRQEVSEKTKIHTDYLSSPLYKDLPMPTRLAEFPNAITYRDVVIDWATRQRATQDDIYSRKVVHVIASGSAGKKVVVSDWRFRCEEKTLTAAFPDAKIVRIRILRDSVVPHASPSEHELDDFPMDVVLTNNGSISDLRSTLHHLPALHT